MTNTMGLVPADLANLPGAPFTQDEIDAAVASMRAAAGWHIAPEVEETAVVLDVLPCEIVLRLPTRYLVSVEEVRDADTDVAIEADRYRVSKALGQVARKSGYWPAGYQRVEVDFTHGYEDVPLELLPLIAQSARTARLDQNVSQLTAGPFSIGLGSGSNSDAGPFSASAVFDRYKLWQPGIA